MYKRERLFHMAASGIVLLACCAEWCVIQTVVVPNGVSNGSLVVAGC